MKSEEALITSTMVALLGYLHKQHAVGSTQTCHSLYKHTVRQSYIEVDESLFCFRLSVQAFSTNKRSKEKGDSPDSAKELKKRYAWLSAYCACADPRAHVRLPHGRLPIAHAHTPMHVPYHAIHTRPYFLPIGALFRGIPCKNHFKCHANILSLWHICLSKVLLLRNNYNAHMYTLGGINPTAYSTLSLIRSPLGQCSLTGIVRWLYFRK